MSLPQPIRIRRSIQSIQDDYERGNKTELECLMRAWKGIKELPPDHPRSFFRLAGYHGEPFRGAGWGTGTYWGGYCNHGNVLFPTWHRVYLLKLEEALRSIPGCEGVSLPFWDETAEDSLNGGIPWALTRKDFVLDGQTIPNPLRSFVLNSNIADNISGDNPDYSKPAGYETVRYPLSGLVGPQDIAKTKIHNEQFPDYQRNVEILNGNIATWLNSATILVDGVTISTNVHEKYVECLNAPNYTVFSNTTSSTEWNTNLPEGAVPVRALESPHNDIHLAVGGCEVPGFDVSLIDGANGDMGENDTAAFDPIFFFHHCFVDRVFWLWQQAHHATEGFDIIPEYPGTNTVDNQGPTPGMAPNTWLTMASPLNPFLLTEGGQIRPYTSLDCVNIERQLGYLYGPGSLEGPQAAVTRAANGSTQLLRVAGINRGAIRGSFTISAFATIDGKRLHLGTESILSRWHVAGCANCQTHLEAKAFFGLRGLAQDVVATTPFTVEVRTRDGLLGQPAALATGTLPARRLFRFAVR
jgi:tyrosinase